MKYKIGVFGSAKENLSPEIYKLSEDVGKYIAESGNILITGAAKGISRYAAKGAKENQGYVIGYSPTSKENEKSQYQVDFEYIDELIHTGQGYKGRNVISVRNCDGIIAINGGFGTLNEITIAEGESKPIVIIEKSGGTADLIKSIFKKLNPDYKKIAYVNNSKDAVKQVIKLIQIDSRRKI